MLKASSALLLFISCCFAAPQSGKAAGDIEVAGDILQVLIPATAYGTTLYLSDKEGELQMYKSFFTSLGITFAVKVGVNKERPNGGNYSFPSGHTSASFQGAAFIHARYGLNHAIPAYIAAAFVGYSRVESSNHYVSDVLAGAALGTACSFYFTEPNKKYVLQPITTEGSYGLQISGVW